MLIPLDLNVETTKSASEMQTDIKSTAHQELLKALTIKRLRHSTCRVFLYDARLSHLGSGDIYIPVPNDAQPLRLPEQHGIRPTRHHSTILLPTP